MQPAFGLFSWMHRVKLTTMGVKVDNGKFIRRNFGGSAPRQSPGVCLERGAKSWCAELRMVHLMFRDYRYVVSHTLTDSGWKLPVKGGINAPIPVRYR